MHGHRARGMGMRHGAAGGGGGGARGEWGALSLSFELRAPSVGRGVVRGGGRAPPAGI
jgi:hypothetical protein